MGYRIRPAATADIVPILALLPRLAAFELPPGRVPEHLWLGDAELLRAWGKGAVPEGLVVVAEDDDGVLLGAAIARLREELLSHAPSAHLEVLVVRQGAEGQGVGRALIDEVERLARERGAESMTLHVFATNARARALYERLGYTGELVRYSKNFT